MPYEPARGHTLLIPSGTNQDPEKKHLFVLITDRCAAGSHMLVSLSTIREGVFHDPACVVDVGEHPFVKAQSFIEYRMARMDTAIHLQRCVDGWTFLPKENVSRELLEKICGGLQVSEHITKSMLNYYNCVTAQ